MHSLYRLINYRYLSPNSLLNWNKRVDTSGLLSFGCAMISYAMYINTRKTDWNGLGDNLYVGILHKVDSSQTLHENQLSVRHKLSQQKSDIYVYIA